MLGGGEMPICVHGQHREIEQCLCGASLKVFKSIFPSSEALGCRCQFNTALSKRKQQARLPALRTCTNASRFALSGRAGSFSRTLPLALELAAYGLAASAKGAARQTRRSCSV